MGGDVLGQNAGQCGAASPAGRLAGWEERPADFGRPTSKPTTTADPR